MEKARPEGIVKNIRRRKSRENAFVALFSASFNESITDVLQAFTEDESEYCVDAFGRELLRLVEQYAGEVDRQIELRLRDWTVQRLSRVNLAVLRLAVAELLYGEAGMDSVIINEAVELGRRFGGDEDYQFINGVLGSLSRDRAAEYGGGQTAVDSGK